MIASPRKRKDKNPLNYTYAELLKDENSNKQQMMAGAGAISLAIFVMCLVTGWALFAG